MEKTEINDVINKKVMLTTIDNPFNPFTDFEKWLAFDREKGYYTCEYLDRITEIDIEMTDFGKKIIIENAIDEIVKLNLLGIYKKVEMYE